MARNRYVTVAAIVTLALAIGVNTAVFSVVNGVLLKPLPYFEPDRLVTIPAQIPSMRIFGAQVEYNTFVEWWRKQARSFESWAAYTPAHVNMTSGGQPERLAARRVTAGFLSVVGVRPVVGRDFLAEEDQPGGPRAAILSYALWQRRFGGGGEVLGRTLILDDATYTVVGVLPREFQLFGPDTEIYTALAAPTARVAGMPTVTVVARVKSGVPLATAQAEIDAICRQWVQTYPYPRDWGARIWRVHDLFVRDVRASLLLVAISVALVLLIACANVANLLLARAGSRQREMAIRGTLGASRYRIARQLLTESALLGICGALCGFIAAWAGVRLLASAGPYMPLQSGVGIDLRVLLFTLAATLVTTVLFGLAPALAAVRTNLAEDLKDTGRAGEGLGRARFRSALVVGEVALAVLLAIGASLSGRSLMRLQAVDPGFQAEGVLTAEVTLPREAYTRPAQRSIFYRTLRERIEALPGVESASMVSHLPFGGTKSGSDVTVDGAPPPKPGDQRIVFGRRVGLKYFEVIHARLIQGRDFTERDPAGPPIAMINETMAKRFWPGTDPVGKRFALGPTLLTVVGIVADMRQTSLADEPDGEFYIPHGQVPDHSMALVVRTKVDAMTLAPAVRAAVWSLDKSLPVSKLGTLEDRISQSNRSRHFSVALMGSFALLALTLAAVGIYGVISYNVARRTHEIGIRIALGAERHRVAGLVIWRAVALAGVGAAIGVAGGIGLARFVQSILFGVTTTDPTTYTAVIIVVLAVAALAAYVPAARAACVDPVVALRCE